MAQKRTAKKTTKKKTSAKPKPRAAKKPAKPAAAAKSRQTSTKSALQVTRTKLPRMSKEGPRDIALLSFPENATSKQPRKQAVGALGLGIAANVADRHQVPDTRVEPFRKICDLLITANDGSPHSGTAWFIAPRVLVTAGHCVAVHSPGTAIHGMVRTIRVMPARRGEVQASNSFFGWVEVGRENLRVHPRWLQNGDLDFDYGAIILPPNQAIGATVGFFRPENFPDQQLNGAVATLAGYPDNVPEGTQWFETNPIRQVTPRRLFYDIFSSRGQSGSPLFFVNGPEQIACAIHNLGRAPFNTGVRITPEVINQLNTWIAESQ